MSKTKNIKCDVCGKEDKFARTKVGRLGLTRLTYCQDCFREGLEPYHAILIHLAVNYNHIKSYEEVPKEFQKMIDKVLILNNKSVKDFESDLKDMINDFKNVSN